MTPQDEPQPATAVINCPGCSVKIGLVAEIRTLTFIRDAGRIDVQFESVEVEHRCTR